MGTLMENINNRFDFEWKFDDSKNVGNDECGNLFDHQQKKCDKHLIYKSFVNTFTRNEVSLVRPYMTNPTSFSCFCFDCLNYRSEKYISIDKEEFLTLFSEYVNSLHAYDKVVASIIPLAFRKNYDYANVLVKTSTMELRVCIDISLNRVYRVEIFESSRGEM